MHWGLMAVALWLVGPGTLGASETATPVGPPTSEPRALQGRVVGPTGEPVEGAAVQFRVLDPDDEPPAVEPPRSVVHTDGKGRFSSGDIEGLRFALGVLAEGHAFWTRRDHDPSEPLVVKLERGRAATGRVLDENGRGLAGVHVTLSDGESFDLTGPEVATDEAGAYRFEHAPSGTVWVRASAPGRATRSVKARLPKRDEPGAVDDLWLPDGGSVTGTVVDEQGDPVAGASVWIAPLDNGGGAFRSRFPVVEGRSDEAGQFELRGVTAGARYRIGARAEGHARGVTGPLSIEAGSLLDDVTVRLQTGATLRVRLVDGEGRPAERIAIHLDSEADGDRDGSTQSQTVEPDSGRLERGEDGWWTVHELSPGVFAARFDPDGFLGLRRPGVVLRDGETTSLGTLTLESGSSVHGRVVDGEGSAVAGAEVRARWQDMRGAYSRTANSSETGTFVIAGLPDFAVTLEARADGFAAAVVESVATGATGDEDPLVVALERPGGLRGRVRLAEGGAPSSFDVRVVPRRRARATGDEADPPVEQTTDAFEVLRLDPGTYAVEVRAPARATGRVDRVRVRAGEVFDLDEIRLERGLRLRGRVVGADGVVPVPGARVRIDRGSGPSSWTGDPAEGRARSSLDGGFSIDGLEPGRHTITIDHADFAPLQRSVVIDAEGSVDVVPFQMTNGGTIAGSVLDADELPVAGARIMVVRPNGGSDVRIASTLDDGSFRISRLAPGSYLVIRTRSAARGPFGNEMRTAEVREGRVAEVRFAD